MTHTPGPWKVIRKVGYTIYPEEDKSVYIAFMNEARDNSEANANLMATAPEMLEALEQVVINWEYQKKTGGKHFTSAPTEQEWKEDSREKTRAMVERAIAKAKGE